MHKYDFDIVVIGAGPGGYETAIKAAQMGKKTCIIEEHSFGGTCLNVGCIPTKALIHTAVLYNNIKEADKFAIEGIDTSTVKVNMESLQTRKNRVVNTLVNGVKALLKANGVHIVEGKASFEDVHTLVVKEQKITAENVIIATGSNVFMPPFIACSGENNILSSTEALMLNKVPESMVVIGGGVIGVEFAFLLNKLGTKIVVLELMDHILPMVDTEISQMAQRRMTKEGITFTLGAKVTRIESNTVYYEVDGAEHAVSAEAILMAVGRVPNVDGLNAEKIGIEFEKRAIKTNEMLQTNIPHIYAIGDVNGKVMLAHTASHEGMVAVSNICGIPAKMDYDRIPSCIYLEPEIACIGMSETQARSIYGDHIKVGRFNMAGNGKSLIAGDVDGMFKVLVHAETGKILGVHLYGQHVTDMIGEVSVAMSGNLSAEEVLEAIHPHPTVNEALGEAFMAAWNGRAINWI